MTSVSKTQFIDLHRNKAKLSHDCLHMRKSINIVKLRASMSTDTNQVMSGALALFLVLEFSHFEGWSTYVDLL